MVTDAVRARAAPRVGALATSWAGSVALVALLLAFSAFTRTRALDVSFWIDEGLSVGIASYPFFDIPGVLRQDGSPPLYYMLLHVWIDLFGSSEAATHALSVAFALLAVPAAFWAARTIFDRRVAWIATAFTALNPFLTAYSTETRMYSLVMLLSILATAAFVHGFVLGRRRYVALFAALLAVMLYTHYWGLFFAVGAAAALVVCLLQLAERRRVLVDAGLAFGGAAVLFLPWVPTLAFHARHTGAPWSSPPGPVELLTGISALLAGQGTVMALALGGGVGIAAVLRGRPSRERTALAVCIALALGTLLSGWLFSQVAPAWANRYLGTLLGPLVLLTAVGLARAGRLGLVAFAVVVLFWAGFRPSEDKSDVKEIGVKFGPLLEPGDVVVSTQPEQVPVIHYYLPPGLRYATPMGLDREPRIMDWRDAVSRLERSRAETHLGPVLDQVAVGGRVLLVRPVFRDPDAWSAPWTRLVRLRSIEWDGAVAADERFDRVAVWEPSPEEAVRHELRAELYVRAER